MLKVALIDDEKDLGLLFVDTYSSDEIQITYFSDPESAIKSLDTFDVYFIDYRMPHINGDELAHKLPPSPKYMITGEINPKPAYPFLKIIAKPYFYEDIQNILNNHLNLAK